MSSLAHDHGKAGELVTQPSKSATYDEVDAAWRFLDNHRDTASVAEVNLGKLRRKIDWRIVPLMFCCYTMQFLDKVIYNVSFHCLFSHSDKSPGSFSFQALAAYFCPSAVLWIAIKRSRTDLTQFIVCRCNGYYYGSSAHG